MRICARWLRRSEEIHLCTCTQFDDVLKFPLVGLRETVAADNAHVRTDTVPDVCMEGALAS